MKISLDTGISIGPMQRRDIPTLDVSFLSGVLDPRFTFTRASTADYTDITGATQTAAINVPRFDYDPTTHEPRGLWIQPASAPRAAEGCVTTDLSWLNPTQGTFIFDILKTVAPTGTPGIFALGNPALAFGAANTLYSGVSSSPLWGQATTALKDGASQVSSSNAGGALITSGVVQRVGLSFAPNSVVGSVAGSIGTVDTSVILPTGMTHFSIGSFVAGWSGGGASNQLDGYVRRVRYFPWAMLGAELQAKTA